MGQGERILGQEGASGSGREPFSEEKEEKTGMREGAGGRDKVLMGNGNEKWVGTCSSCKKS
jgi:hypothetical protein